jgi:hypothetical protein
MERSASPYDPRVRPDKPHRRQAEPRGLPPQSQSAVAYFDRFTEWRKLALPRSRSWALCPHHRYRRDKPRGGDLAAASFAPLELAGFSDGPALTVEITAPSLDVSNPPSHTPLRSEKHDSGKMENIVGDSFLGISHVMSDTWLVGYRSQQRPMPNSGTGSHRRTCCERRRGAVTQTAVTLFCSFGAFDLEGFCSGSDLAHTSATGSAMIVPPSHL